MVRQWHGRPAPAPAIGMERVDVPGRSLLVLGRCTVLADELVSVARDVADGKADALARIEEGCVVAVWPDEVLVPGPGQCPLFPWSGSEPDIVVAR